ncbi:hypothetical protein [Leifsonia sp. EB34]|uniref:hypothetical protein n=1 Tax=Leifsonia sp. EB34 TaxID=3156303 RepID=UPI0035128942
MITSLGFIDPVGVVREVLEQHDAGQCTLPGEGYLAWTNTLGAYSRSIAMPGSVTRFDGSTVHGMKLINASISNPSRGLARAAGIGFTFDPLTARVDTVMEAAVLSGVRTASVTALGILAMNRSEFKRLSVVGCGSQARMHLALLLDRHPSISGVTLYDADPSRANSLASVVRGWRPALSVAAAASAREAIEEGTVTLLLTTADEGYVARSWLPRGSLIANVSLGDLTDEALLEAGTIVCDDLDLIRENPRRPLGRLLADGRVHPVDESTDGPRMMTLGGLLSGRDRYRDVGDYAVLNPFGMSILDVGLFDAVRRVAREKGMGEWVTL